jgi:nicotinamidase-related amidase
MVKWQNPVLVIIDMQRDFLDPGAPIEIPRGREIIPNLARLLSSCRKLRVPVVHVITIHRRNGKDWEILEPSRVPPHCIENTDGAQIVSELRPLENEFVVVKKRYSAFFNTELDTILRRLQANTLIVAGVTTECCVRSTAFDAYFRDYQVIVPIDCTDSVTETKKKSTLGDIVDCVGDVISSSEVIGAMAAQAGST